VLADKYRVERILGQGGMGVVVEARHIALDERVALKFLLPEYANHPEASARFLREARAAVRIKSEHIARVSDVGRLDSSAPYMVMEFLEGCDLSHVLEKSGVLAVEDAVDYVIQGCDAIIEAHSLGIVHRDLKPANLFLSKRPNGEPIIKVLDFGISKTSEAGVDNLTKTTAAMGSALYMSPEQMQQTRGVDHRTDIYALGISLYELLAGRQPFYAETMPQLCAEIFAGMPTPIRQLRPEISDGLAAVLERAYARDRELRYQTIAEFVAALAPWAPARSQPVIDSIAKLASIEAPKAGVPGQSPLSLAATNPLVQARGGTFVMASAADSPSASQSVKTITAATAAAMLPTTGNPVVSAVASTAAAGGARKRGAGSSAAIAVVAVLGLMGGGGFVAWRAVQSRAGVAGTGVGTARAPSAPELTLARSPAVLEAATASAAAPVAAAALTAPPTAGRTFAASEVAGTPSASAPQAVPALRSVHGTFRAPVATPLPEAPPPTPPGNARNPWDRAGF
jgi:serine/threonine protein kinase